MVKGKRRAYWALVESRRTAVGPRQHEVAYLGEMDDAGRLGIKQTASGRREGLQLSLFEETVQPDWVEVDVSRVRAERGRSFGGPWLGLQIISALSLDEFLETVMPGGKEDVPWAVMSELLVLCRLCNPSSELAIAEQSYEMSALPDLLGVPACKVNDDRLYRALDRLLPHKRELEVHLKERMGELFSLDYDLLLYDITSTYFEGTAMRNSQAKRGYSRDHRSDCKQVCIALVVSREGLPLAYEVFDGNRADVTTVEEIVEQIESRYGKSARVWAMDRGMVSEDNVEWLRKGGRRYILGTPKGQLKQYERELVGEGWEQIRDGLEVKLCPGPDGGEMFILCRSQGRQEKEKAMHARAEERIEKELDKIVAACTQRRCNAVVIAKRVGRMLGKNSRAAGLFHIDIAEKGGRAEVAWRKVDEWRSWAEISEGCYMLRTNITDWSAQELWEAYIQLTQAEAAFRIHKDDLELRPIWHQKAERVQAHILVCFLAFVLWKALGRMCKGAGIGDEPRKVFRELASIQMVDIVLPTRSGVDIRLRRVLRPEPHQAILLQHLGLRLPETPETPRILRNVVEKRTPPAPF
jgi:transposase